MDWAKLGELSVGLAAAALILWIVLVKAKRNGNGNGKHGTTKRDTSAGLTAAEWQTAIFEIVKKALLDTAPQRHADLEKLMERVLEREFLSRNEKLRAMMKEVLDESAKKAKR